MDIMEILRQYEDYIAMGITWLPTVLFLFGVLFAILVGFVREVISKIQTMRKESDFEVTDKIVVYVSGNEKISQIVKANAEEIKGDVLALEIKYEEATAISKEWNINGETVTIGVEK